MSQGLLGKAMSIANDYVTVYTVPTDVLFAAVSINIVNTDQGSNDTRVRIAVTDQATPQMVDHIDYGSVIPRNGGILERTCAAMAPGEKIMVWADSPHLAIRVHGLEEVPAA